MSNDLNLSVTINQYILDENKLEFIIFLAN